MTQYSNPVSSRFHRMVLALLCGGLLLLPNGVQGWIDPDSLKNRASFSFTVTADMRMYTGGKYRSPKTFQGVCEKLLEIGPGAFMISPGDIDPPGEVRRLLDEYLGPAYPWYPVVGNHEAETRDDMDWLRDWGRSQFTGLARRGPPRGEETSYTFDYQDLHCVVLNQYYDGLSDTGTDGDVGDVLYQWLERDLRENSQPLVLVFGHEPLVSIPDMDNGRVRHRGNGLDNYPEHNHRFQMLLKQYGVRAYFCGHTHNASFANINGLWQIDVGHARGHGDPGAFSTIVKVWVTPQKCLVEFYRDDGSGGNYTLRQSVIIP